MTIEAEFQALATRLATVLRAEGCPGLVVGISGTDSVIAFLLAAEALRQMGQPDRLLGVHFGAPAPDSADPAAARALALSPSWLWVPRVLLPWLAEQAPAATLAVCDTPETRDDPGRWAELARRALANQDPTQPFQHEGTYWVMGTRNATEVALGSYSNLSGMVSVQPIENLWKSEVLAWCKALGVPAIAAEHSRQVDCDCGRFDLAATHIEAIDALLQSRAGVPVAALDLATLTPDLQSRLEAFIAEQTAYAAFKRCIPYRP